MAKNKFSSPCLYGAETKELCNALNEDFGQSDIFCAEILGEPHLEFKNPQSQLVAEGYLDVRIELRSDELRSLLDTKLAGLYAFVRSSRAKCCKHYELCEPIQDRSTPEVLDATYRISLPIREMFGQSRLEVAIIGTASGIWQHSDPFDGEVVDIQMTPGRICAYQELLPNFEVERDELERNIGSVFVMRVADHVPSGTFNCSLYSGDKLIINVARDMYKQMTAFCQSSNHSKLFTSTVVVPCLANVLNQLYAEKSKSAYETCKWYQLIERTLMELGEESILSRSSDQALCDAQLLLSSPLSNFLKHRDE